MTTAVWP